MSRRAPFVLATCLAIVSIALPAAAQTSFTDVAGVHEPAITALGEAGVVAGCEEDRFCPESGLTRGQVASLLARSLDLDTSATEASPRFRDTADSVHAPAIEAIAAAGITGGCTESDFCPTDRVSRGQLATLIQRAFELPAASEGRYFDDIAGNVHAPAVESLAAAGVAAGCTPIAFCPGGQLTRAQGASFLARALDLVDRVDVAPYDERRAQHDRDRERRAQEAVAATGERAVEVALDQVGTPYRYGGNGPAGFDCSGLTGYAWRAAGVDLPRTSSDQHRATTRIDRADLQPGDLVFYHQPVSHVAMYIGDGRIVEAPSSGGHVRVSDSGLSRSDITGYGRPS